MNIFGWGQKPVVQTPVIPVKTNRNTEMVLLMVVPSAAALSGTCLAIRSIYQMSAEAKKDKDNLQTRIAVLESRVNGTESRASYEDRLTALEKRKIEVVDEKGLTTRIEELGNRINALAAVKATPVPVDPEVSARLQSLEEAVKNIRGDIQNFQVQINSKKDINLHA